MTTPPLLPPHAARIASSATAPSVIASGLPTAIEHWLDPHQDRTNVAQDAWERMPIARTVPVRGDGGAR